MRVLGSAVDDPGGGIDDPGVGARADRAPSAVAVEVQEVRETEV